MSSLACKSVFYRPELSTKNWNPWSWILNFLKCQNEVYQQIGLTQKVNKKNMVIWSYDHVYSWFMVIKLSKMNFLFSPDDNKELISVWALY